ncbi:MAG: 50S ribosomal protein L11 methyltransferase [Chthoniobacterales bacterium]|nr:50S ribosomal protein L11 methyltransferase [Chthoniobacterales bacterium]
MAKQAWRWVRNAPAKHEEGWRERLSFLGPSCLVVHGRPRAKVIRLEAYADNAAALRQVAEVFGGKVEKFDADKIALQANAPRRPLRIGPTIGVIDTHGRWPEAFARPRIVLRIASAMAFGTGEHATTSACLRFLADEARECEPGWSCLDLGTGSGILAIAAEKLGAGQVRGLDHDPRAVKAAQANVRRNRCRLVRVAAGDLLAWRPGRKRYRIVLANVFSELLRTAAPRIVRSVTPGGCLVLSGILRAQEKEVLAAFRALGMKPGQASRRGKWVTLCLQAC